MIQGMLSSHAGSSGGRQDKGGHSGSTHHILSGKENSYHDGSGFEEGFKPKTVRLEFPRFNGEDPKMWCCRAERFFDHYGTPDTQRLNISSFHMEGRAMVWFQELKASKTVSNWEEFVRAIQIRFCRGAYDDPMETLSKLKQEGLLEDYKTKFDTLSLKVQGLPEAHKLSCFLGGLKDEIRLPVRMFNPKSHMDAYSLARIQEECVLNSTKNVWSVWRSTQLTESHRGFSTDLPVGAAKGSNFAPPKGNQFGQQKQDTWPSPRMGQAWEVGHNPR
jgi:hypothetical protein